MTVIEIVLGTSLAAMMDAETGVPDVSTLIWNLTAWPGATLLRVIQPSPIRTLFLSNRYREKASLGMALEDKFSATVSMRYVRRFPKEPASLNLPSVKRNTGVPESGQTMICDGWSLARASTGQRTINRNDAKPDFIIAREF